MGDVNTSRKLSDVVKNYEKKFGKKSPEFLMMESTEDYINELERAIQKNKPIRQDGEGRPAFDIVY